MRPVFSRFLLVTTVFFIALGAGTSTISQRPSPEIPQGGSPITNRQTDFSGTYDGRLQYYQMGMSGPAQLVITGNSFKLTFESAIFTGRITVVKTRDGRATVTMVFESQPPGSDVSSISLIGIKKGPDIWLASLPRERVVFYFGNGKLLEKLGTGPAPGASADPEPRKAAMRAAPKSRRAQQVGSASSAEPPSEGPEDSTVGAPPPVGSSATATPDNELRGLKGDANLVFNTPESMRVDETKTIELLVSPSKSIEELKPVITEDGKVVTGSTRYADRMEAQLTSTGFTITPISPAIQPVEPAEITKWMWQIKPKDGGAQRLVLSLNMVLNDGKDRRMVETFKRDINIKVSWTQRASSFVGGLKEMQWLWAAIILPIGGAIYGWWRKKQKGRRRKKGPVREKKSSQP